MDIQEEKKIKFFKTFKWRMTRSVIAAAVLVIIVMILIAAPTAEKSLNNVTSDYIFELASSKGDMIERAIEAAGDPQKIFTEHAEDMLKNCKVRGMDSSYAYLVDDKGTMVYHPTKDKIGHPVENSVIKSVISDIKNGKKIKNQTVLYKFDGVKQYVSYYVPKGRSFVLVVSCDYSDVMKPVYAMTNKLIFWGLITACAAGALALFVTTKQLSIIDIVNGVIDRMGRLDLSHDEELEVLSGRKDEFGIMSRVIKQMKRSLKDTVSVIKDQAEGLRASSDALLDNTVSLSETADQVDTAVNDIAEGATSQAQQTQDAQTAVVDMGDQISEITGNVTNLNTISDKMSDANSAADKTITALNQINQKTQKAIADISESTKKTDSSASEIREAASLIGDIAKQTNLLSLNASIEAARAGEHGKGFAVVAESIGGLASQSKDAADKINEIIERLVAVANESVQTMDEVMGIVKEQSDEIVKTSNAFSMINDGIAESGTAVKQISSQADGMNTSKNTIINTLEGLSSIAEENAAATEQSSASVTQMTANMDDIKKQSNGVKDAAEKLMAEVDKFKL